MEAPRQPKLEVRAVSLDYHNERTKQVLPVLRGIDLKVFEGELVCIVGPSGCGKTTLLNAVDGLIDVTAGQNFVGNREITGAGPGPAMVLSHDLVDRHPPDQRGGLPDQPRRLAHGPACGDQEDDRRRPAAGTNAGHETSAVVSRAGAAHLAADRAGSRDDRHAHGGLRRTIWTL